MLGPDGYCRKHRLDGDLSLTMHGWVLHLRGQKVLQPKEHDGNLLLFNGEIFGGDFFDQLNGGNDTEFLSNALRNAKSQEDILNIISGIHGPFAFIFWKKDLNKLYYGRDVLGRRSLLKLKSRRSQSLILASVSEELDDDEWEEVATTGVFGLDLQDFKEFEISWADMGKVGIPRLNTQLPHLERQDFSVTLADFKITDQYQNALTVLHQALFRSLKSRIQCIPVHKDNQRARLAILFSGGLDCTIIAGMAHSIVPIGEPIDLLNVAFENPRKSNSTFDVPDRITGRKSHQELCRKFPERMWNFVEINVSFIEYMNAKPRVTRLMNPCLSVMDLSIAMALWFASSGVGRLNNKEFKTSAKVLFSGLGADELFGGYSRHAAAFSHSGWEGLVKEIQMDMDRIATRNLGRDDRIISDNGKEVRFPFLDEEVLIKITAIPIHLKMNLGYPKGMGDKLLLRLLCHHILKCEQVAKEPKRAIQFGSRTAKIESDAKGHVSSVQIFNAVINDE
jgi:asparagine synthetase B (glutamine-hydrolysing)